MLYQRAPLKGPNLTRVLSNVLGFIVESSNVLGSMASEAGVLVCLLQINPLKTQAMSLTHDKDGVLGHAGRRHFSYVIS